METVGRAVLNFSKPVRSALQVKDKLHVGKDKDHISTATSPKHGEKVARPSSLRNYLLR